LFKVPGLLLWKSLVLLEADEVLEGATDGPPNSRFSDDFEGFFGSLPSICLIITKKSSTHTRIKVAANPGVYRLSSEAGFSPLKDSTNPTSNSEKSSQMHGIHIKGNHRRNKTQYFYHKLNKTQKHFLVEKSHHRLGCLSFMAL
jgi:hypothetical protein